jgi:hypothetical protein
MVLSTRVRVLLMAMVVVGMALGIICVLGAVGSASPNNNNDDHRDDKGRILTVVGKTPENKVLDLGAQGPTQDDMRVVNAPLYNATGMERIGRFDLLCAITDPADESAEEAHMAQCTKTFTVPGGQISVQGVEAYPNLSALAPGVNAISGGTGKYAGATPQSPQRIVTFRRTSPPTLPPYETPRPTGWRTTKTGPTSS